MTNPEVPLSPLESARQALASSKAEVETARAALSSASHALSVLKPADHASPAEYAKELETARAAVASAEVAVAFWSARAASDEATLAPLELDALRVEVKCGLAARSLALGALRTACEQLGPQLGRVREAVSLVRESEASIQRALGDLRQRGDQPERPAPDDLADLVVHSIEGDLGAPSGALSAALAIVRFEEEAPQREALKAEAARAAEATAKRQYDDECRRGVHGEGDRNRVIAELRAEAKRFYPAAKSAMIIGTRGTHAALELGIERKTAGLE
jgi:hypothetical protein